MAAFLLLGDSMKWSGKSFHSLNFFMKNKFGEKIVKIPIDAGFTCPNRDGLLSTGGCIFCSGRGSGDFIVNNPSITAQFYEYIKLIKKKWPKAKYIPYFQAFTNTYADVNTLRKKYYEALSLENIVGLSIATRPDCLNDEIISLLKEINEKTFLMVELGLQSSKPATSFIINRCHDNEIFESAVKKLKDAGINVVCHVILGLPYETKSDMLNTVKYAVNTGIDGIKLHLLYICEDTEIAKMYKRGEFKALEFDEYIDILISAIEIIPENIVIHRITGDPPRDKVIAPQFSVKKFELLNAIDREFKQRNTYQGKFKE